MKRYKTLQEELLQGELKGHYDHGLVRKIESKEEYDDIDDKTRGVISNKKLYMLSSDVDVLHSEMVKFLMNRHLIKVPKSILYPESSFSKCLPYYLTVHKISDELCVGESNPGDNNEIDYNGKEYKAKYFIKKHFDSIGYLHIPHTFKRADE